LEWVVWQPPLGQQLVPSQQLLVAEPQTSFPGAQQVPWLHTFPLRQLFVQVPQWASSVERSAQTPGVEPHWTSEPGQPQVPFTQSPPVGQTVQLAPQAEAFVCWFTHAPGFVPQTAVPVGQVQVPAEQLPLVGQATQPAPQAVLSVSWFTQRPGLLPHTLGAVPGQVQLPGQVAPVGQTARQAVQFLGSIVMSTHLGQSASEQEVTGGGSQLQVPPEQVPRPQGWLQAPQFAVLVWRSTHAPAQSVCPAGHSQVPATQEPPVGQVTQPGPQVAASVWESTQLPKHRVWPEEHFFSEAGQAARRSAEAARADARKCRREGDMESTLPLRKHGRCGRFGSP
jgi:hypothetical protein